MGASIFLIYLGFCHHQGTETYPTYYISSVSMYIPALMLLTEDETVLMEDTIDLEDTVLAAEDLVELFFKFSPSGTEE